MQQEKIHDIIFNRDDITWKSILFDLIKKENMDPWNIDVSTISEKFLELLKTFKKMDFKISGKVILASALLLKLKSDKFLKNDFSKIDEMFSSTVEDDEDIYEDDFNYTPVGTHEEGDDKLILVPRTPQPRTRKVSIFDLVNALEQALEVKQRRVNRLSRSEAPEVTKPIQKFDISKGMEDLYGKITGLFAKKQRRISFDELIPSDAKEDKIYTFIPLLHLSNQRKVDVFQEQHFGDIQVEILRIQKELEKSNS